MNLASIRQLLKSRAFGEVARFAVVGALAYCVDAGVLHLTIWLGATPLLGRVGSITTALVFTWLLNRTLTFASTTPPSLREFAHYVSVSLVGLLINYAIFSVAILAKAPTLAALAMGTAVAAVFNFIRYRALLGQAATDA